MLRRLQVLLSAAAAAGILFSGSFLGTARPALAQAAVCGAGKAQPSKLQSIKAALKEMSTNDPAVIDRNFEQYTKAVDYWRALTPGQENNASKLYGDALEFWREKKAHEATGGMVDVQAGRLWTSYLQKKVDELESIDGSWDWWNGYTVTFTANGGATYRGSSLARSGVGRWQKTGGNSYHVHWLNSNTNDYFTLSSDGLRLEGTYDGKPGVSTRKC